MRRAFFNQISMKRIFVFFAVLSVLCSCNSSKNAQNSDMKMQKNAETEFLSELSQVDSSLVAALAGQFMENMKAGSIEAALDLLYVLNDDVLYKPSDEYLTQLRSRFTHFPVVSYKLERISFSTKGNNDLSFVYAFAEAAEGEQAPTMKLMFNPVMIDGNWYLTLKDGNQSSKDLPKDKQVHPNAPAPADPVLNVQ